MKQSLWSNFKEFCKCIAAALQLSIWFASFSQNIASGKKQYKNNTNPELLKWGGGGPSELKTSPSSHYLLGRMPQGPHSKAQNALYLEIFKTSCLIYFSLNLPLFAWQNKKDVAWVDLLTRGYQLLSGSMIRMLKQEVCVTFTFWKKTDRNGWVIHLTIKSSVNTVLHTWRELLQPANMTISR